MKINLQNYKIILQMTEEEVRLTSLSQSTSPLEYEAAKKKYIIAYNAFVSAMNDFCSSNSCFNYSTFFRHINDFDKYDRK